MSSQTLIESIEKIMRRYSFSDQKSESWAKYRAILIDFAKNGPLPDHLEDTRSWVERIQDCLDRNDDYSETRCSLEQEVRWTHRKTKLEKVIENLESRRNKRTNPYPSAFFLLHGRERGK